ncbi:MAG: hypothetical protein HZY76_00645 [Anaerolineae bacterium]|nr:MAG: hypothetical protein HZY76_00645 [Anaerolineae bacterium]
MTVSRVALEDDPYWVYYPAGGSAGDPLALPDLGIYYEEIIIAGDVRMWAFANTFHNMPHMRAGTALPRGRAGKGQKTGRSASGVCSARTTRPNG